MRQCAVGLFLAWTILGVKSTETLKAQPRPVVPSETLTYGDDDSKKGRDLELLPSPSITAGNLTEEQLHVLQKESKSSDFFLQIYLTFKR